MALLITPSPLAHMFGQKAGIRAEFFPYAAPLQFGRHSNNPRTAYKYDIGFSGGWQKLSGRYPFRKKVFSSNSTARLSASGVRVFNPGWLVTEQYIESLARTKVWLATSEYGAHVGPRFFEAHQLESNCRPVGWPPPRALPLAESLGADPGYCRAVPSRCWSRAARCSSVTATRRRTTRSVS